MSFLSNVLDGLDINYHSLKNKYAKKIVAVMSLILCVFIPLTMLCYSSIICWLFKLFSGYSLFFIAYALSIIVLLDREVQVEYYDIKIEEGSESGYKRLVTKTKRKKSLRYTLTIVWGLMLIILGFSICHMSFKYYQNYAFKCRTIYIEEGKNIYHLYTDCFDDGRYHSPIEIKGHQISSKDYQLCPDCETLEDEYEEMDAENQIRWSR